MSPADDLTDKLSPEMVPQDKLARVTGEKVGENPPLASVGTGAAGAQTSEARNIAPRGVDGSPTYDFGVFDLRAYTALIIDDTETNLNILSLQLRRTGLSVFTENNGEAGVDCAVAQQPDIILLDVIMPGIDGFETCRRLKRDGRTQDIPVIFMTALSDTEHKVAGFRVGAVDYVTKPIQLDEVLARVSTHLRLNELTRELQRTNDELSDTLATLRDTQEQLIESEKMAALGGLVAGVAHEINTPVGIGVLAASTLVDELTLLETAYQTGQLKRSVLTSYLETAHDTTHLLLANLQRAADLVQSFKRVAVDQSNLDVRQFAVKAYLHETLFSLLPHLNRTIHTVTITGDEAMTMCSYPGALSQVITNLVMNSLEHAFSADVPGQIAIAVEGDADSVVIHYADDGRGMREQVRARIFEPFFTTARGQGGTGLGMHLVYNLVTQKLDGSIQCSSSPGAGTTFVLTLPSSLQTVTP